MVKKLIVGIAVTLAATFAIAAKPVNDQSAPGFTGVTMTGETISLADFRGQPVILEWTNHECPYVRKHYGSGNMQKTQRAVTEAGAIWISIISSAPGEQGFVGAEEAQRLTAERGVYADHVILDPEGEIGRLYEAKTTPHMFLIDQESVLKYQGAIDDKPSANPRSLEGATNHVLSAWAEFSAGEEIKTAQTKPYGCSVKYAQ
ncbi:MAG: redoxin domain-containing protein [Kordiimonadaceae bacterium]|nr:redoxin domain-containing protein [Kordiimonadaceae bacterium]MBO6570219.1 redoxin domain-containing protein [Kordiimonadaceae bacterium]MBO6965683.1 redoxin domain-containing protein [Kordiimonadaceae bacterium]